MRVWHWAEVHAVITGTTLNNRNAPHGSRVHPWTGVERTTSQTQQNKFIATTACDRTA